MKNLLPPTDDRGVYLLGLAAAVSVSLFAAAMLTRDDKAPRIAAIEHFGIFARPAALRAARPATSIGRSRFIASASVKRRPISTRWANSATCF